MDRPGFTLLPTAIGTCGIAWRDRVIVAVALPEADDDATERRIRRSVPGVERATPPAAVRDVLDRVGALLEGRPVDLADVAVEVHHETDFGRRVHEVVRAIPPGQTLTYGEVAARVGEPGAAQAVGRAMGSNPVPIIVPCHRVVGAGGRPVGFSAPGGVATKQRILRIEGAAAGGQPSLFEPAPGEPTTGLGR
ncbi:methylated-DNA--[protein]-cysteine S-methyltransferase [Iamia sp. SCSIO 61187]|uniref:methylated-DNA--[protein]-cysteine S-methyltransferase n=1 Tax=Iamia sp. SCSIO 61187 TaxID=2722752 RepID=UPI001C634F93|nr:methylated-DNA--[protein]-cysteine S-methyltransferase [Iamia sp. SCSIO 61187]QYG91950.1 methylated-DNA--[protein]-cysteine S-methyltransferase [Iamia sp. SCSIO 61187]